MNPVGLPARICYAVAAFPIAGAAAFYLCIWIVPRLAAYAQGGDTEVDGYGVFQTALGLGAGLGFTASLLGLTLPWTRRRRRSGRGRRILISCVVVVLSSLAFAGRGHAILFDLGFVVWMSYVMAYTYVRHGVLDRSRSPSYRENEN